MKLDICESLLYSYLRHVKKCQIAQINWKPSGNWPVSKELHDSVKAEYTRIQKHKLFLEVFKTGFEQTIAQTEVDVVGMGADGTIYAANTAFHEYGVNYGSKTDTRNRVVKNLLRAHLAMSYYFPRNKHVFMYCSPKVLGPTDEIIHFYFQVLEKEFSSRQTEFVYLSNDAFRDKILMETLDRTLQEFDTSELFLRSFKLLTTYTGDNQDEPGESSSDDKETLNPVTEDNPASSDDEVQQEKPAEITVNNETDDDRKLENEILKVKSRVPKWFQRPKQNNARILINFLKLKEKSDIVSLEELVTVCKGIHNFMGNFVQMNNVADKNHGKVFNGTSENVLLWEPVKDFILSEYEIFKSKNEQEFKDPS